MRRALRLVAAGGCALLGVACVALGYRHAQLALAQGAMERLATPATPAELNRIGNLIEAAAPELIPAARMLRGQWRIRRSAVADATDVGYALDDFRWVAGSRPLSAAAWVATVATKARLHENDPEFHHALERALATGPNESKSFIELFPWLRLRWHWLTEGERSELLAFTVRAAWREPKWVVEQAEQYYFLEPLCGSIGNNRLAILHCERLGWNRDQEPV